MLVIELKAIPKQSLTAVLDNVLYEIDLLETNGCMSANIVRAGVPVVTGQRCVAKQLVIPYKAMEEHQGNFMFLTQNNEMPAYALFQSTQQFVYASNAELLAVRGTDAPVVINNGSAGFAFGAAVVAGVGAAV